MPAHACAALTVGELHGRRDKIALVDVRSPAEFASGHVPGAHNIPLAHLGRALPALVGVSEQYELAFICASGNRSQVACQQAASAGVTAFNLTGGTSAWDEAGKPLDSGADARPVWAMDRQVRLVAGSLILAGIVAGLARPYARWISAGVASGLVYSALSNTCAMASLLGRLPYNQRGGEYDLDAVLSALGK